MAAEEVAENGLDIVAQASVVMADEAPPASRRKASWKTKYLTLKAKCDQLDQVWYCCTDIDREGLYSHECVCCTLCAGQ